MHRVTTNNVEELISQFEKCGLPKPPVKQSVFNFFNVKKPTKSILKNALNKFCHGDHRGHQAFVLALRQCPEKHILERGIKVIQSDRYIGCSIEDKQQVLSQLTSVAEGINKRGLCVDRATFDELMPGTPAKRVKLAPVVYKSHVSDREPLRQQLGGKGMFLQKMQQMKLPVPPFRAIDINLVECFETQRFRVDLIRPFIPDLPDVPSEASLREIVGIIETLRPFEKPKRESWLSGLAQFIVSDGFYQTIKELPQAEAINQSYQQLKNECPNQPVIVRSSGINEDNYGDAQAGKFDSHVQGTESILNTCLKVMASGYQPAICPAGRPQPMTMVLQTCIPCAFGGVVLSHSSLQDDRIKVEYAPGQPRTVVAGSGELTPHRYQLDRTGEPGKTQWQSGIIPAIYQLQSDRDGAYSEQNIPYQPTEAQSQTLPTQVLEELVSAISQLEDDLLCPVDVEFALGQDQKLYILQVRPVTRLTGGSRYAKSMPAAPLISGQLVSEGCCSGVPVSVNRQIAAQELPTGAIIYADHGADWMLEPDVLKKVGGFVLGMGGTNDHVAITLRQAGKPCLIAGEQYSQPPNSGPVTLVAGSFNGTEGACIVPGDQAAEWLACRTQLSQDYDPAIVLSNRFQPVRASFQRPEEGFALLSQQNDRLLNYFHTDRLFHQCLSSEQSKLLSMSAQRGDIARQLQNEVNHFCEDAEGLLASYERFLQLGGETEDTTLIDYRNELPVFRERLNHLAGTLKQLVSEIASALHPGGEASKISGYPNWLASCKALKETLQALNQPSSASAINSIHDFIFLIHKRFVDGLCTVAEQSEMGSVIGFRQDKISGKWIDFVKPGETDLLNHDVQSALKTFDGKVTILNLPTAFRLNARLGVHVCEAEMFEQAEGGKGRKLRLTLSDDFSGHHRSGKLKRCFFLIGTLLAGGMDRKRMVVDFNRATGKLSLSYAPAGSREEMQRYYALCVSVLGGMRNLDIAFQNNHDEKWDVELLETKLGQSEWDIESYLSLFKRVRTDCKPFHSRLNNVYQRLNELGNRLNEHHIDDLSVYKDLLINAYQEFGEASGREFSAYIKEKAKQLPDKVFPLLTPHPQLMALLNPDDIPIKYAGSAAGDNKECVVRALARGEEKVLEHVSERLLKDRDFILELIKKYPDAMGSNSGDWVEHWRDDQDVNTVAACHNACDWSWLDKKFTADKTFVLNVARSGAVRLNDMPVNFELKNNRDVFLALAPHSSGIIIPTRLNNDREVVLAAVCRTGGSLQYASSALKNDKAVVLKAICQNGTALQYASSALKNDKAVVLEAVCLNGQALEYASEQLRNDPDVFVAALSENYRALEYAGEAWKQNRKAVLAVMRQCGSHLDKVADAFKNDQEVVSVAMENSSWAFSCAGERFKGDEQYVRKAINSSPLNIKYASDRFKEDKQFVLDVLKKNGSAFEYVTDDLKKDKEVALASLRGWNGTGDCPIIDANKNLLNNPAFITEAVKITPLAVKHASSRLQEMRPFVKSLLAIDTRVLQYCTFYKYDEELIRYCDTLHPLKKVTGS